MSDPIEIPDHIRKCAVILEEFFTSRGITEWALMGIQSRNGTLRSHLQVAKTALEAILNRGCSVGACKHIADAALSQLNGEIKCPKCGGATRQSANSFECDKCMMLWPKGHGHATDDTGKVLLTKEQHEELLAQGRDLEKTQTELDGCAAQLAECQAARATVVDCCKPSYRAPLSERFVIWLRNLWHWRTARAVRYLSKQLQQDKAFRDSWHANIAMPIYDATRLAGKFEEGKPLSANHVCIHMPIEQANEIADKLLKHLFDA